MIAPAGSITQWLHDAASVPSGYRHRLYHSVQDTLGAQCEGRFDLTAAEKGSFLALKAPRPNRSCEDPLSRESDYLQIDRGLFTPGTHFWIDNTAFDERSALIDLLQMRAVEKETRIINRRVRLSLEPGELIASVRRLGARWRWSKDKTARFLGRLEHRTWAAKVHETQSGTVYLIALPSLIAARSTDIATDRVN